MTGHALPFPFGSPGKKGNDDLGSSFPWWERVDSNHRSRRQQIYSLPHLTALELSRMNLWSWWTDSNPRPADYKSAALPAELHQQTGSMDNLSRLPPLCQSLFPRNANFFQKGGDCVRVRKALEEAPPRCSFCGRELALGSPYWYISGWYLCPDCLPDFAQAEYRSFRHFRKEGME